MSTAVSSWICPQCRRRVPGREALCHCGFARTAAFPSAAGGIVSPGGTLASLPVLAAAAAVCVGAALVLASARPGGLGFATASVGRPRMRGPVGYPALPTVATMRIRHGERGAAPAFVLPAGISPLATASLRPATPAELDWGKAMALLDLPLRRIAADTSVLELSYRRFAEACVDRADGEWLASLKTATLRPGVTLRDGGATVDCETARAHLVTRSDALKADLAAAETVAQANHVLPDHWRTLLATHDLSGWERY